MKILAIDTATASCSAALLLEDRLISRERILERGHAEHILPMVDELLREGAVALTDLSAVAFGRGPGAFTGLRLAASVVQGLAFGAGLSVVPVSDLQALAQQLLASDLAAAHVLACTDARMHEVYWGCFERGARGFALAVGDEHVGSPGEVRLPDTWMGEGRARTCGAGSGFAAYPQLSAALTGALDGIQDRLLPRAQEIAQLAVAEVRAGHALPADQALPVYLRDDVTQVRHGQS